LGVGGMLVLSGCGGGPGPQVGTVPVAADDSAGGFEEVVTAVERANMAVCAPAEGGAYIPLPAPAAAAATAAAFFRLVRAPGRGTACGDARAGGAGGTPLSRMGMGMRCREESG